MAIPSSPLPACLVRAPLADARIRAAGGILATVELSQVVPGPSTIPASRDRAPTPSTGRPRLKGNIAIRVASVLDNRSGDLSAGMEEAPRPHPSIADLERTRFELQLEAATCGDHRERSRIRVELRRVETALVDAQALQETRRDLPELWRAIFGDGEGHLALFSGRRTPRALASPHTAYFRWPGEAATAAHWAVGEAASTREVYQCAHLLTEPHRRKRFAASLQSLYVDLDTDALPPPPLQPSVTVSSSPGRFQCYFRLTEPASPAAGEALNRRLALAVGADRSGWDLTQLLRVPGTRNHKYPAQPWVRLVEISGAVYQPEALDTLLPPLPRVITDTERGTGTIADGRVHGLHAVRLGTRATTIWEGRDVKSTPEGIVDRSTSLVRIARVLYGAGLSAEAIVAALAERDVTLGWRKYSSRDDATEQYERIVRLIVGGER